MVWKIPTWRVRRRIIAAIWSIDREMLQRVWASKWIIGLTSAASQRADA
jgi:hypothetical protein